MARAGRWEPKGGRAPSKDVVVDQIRDLVDHRLALRRFEGRRRFVVVDPADAMNPQAQNALLKTLEEPPEDTTLVLVASSPDTLLPTIRSRCLRVAFAPLPPPPLEPGRADALRAAAALDPGEPLEWLAFARAHGGDREGAAELCGDLEAWLRDVLAVQAGGAGLALPGMEAETRRVAAAASPLEIVGRREAAGRARAALRQNAAPVLALEGMLVGWFHGGA